MTLIWLGDTTKLDLENGTAVLDLESSTTLLLESSIAGEGAVGVYDLLPTYPILFYYWQESVFFQMEPSDQVNPVYAEAWSNLSTWLMPIWAVADRENASHLYPYIFGGTIEPSNYVSSPASWENLSTVLMPEYPSREKYGAMYQWPSFFQVLSTPTFLPDGTGVTAPTSTKPSPGVGTGRTSTKKV